MNFKQQFRDEVEKAIFNVIEDRAERIEFVGKMIDSYVRDTGESPPEDCLNDLSEYILREEILDPHPDKMTRNEYPILSARQESTRRDKEYSFSLSDTYDSTGENKAKPVRRRRTAKEWRNVDASSRETNRARDAIYKRDTSPGAVVTYNLYENGGELTEPFVNCIGIGKRWANEMGAMNETEIVREETENYVQEAA